MSAIFQREFDVHYADKTEYLEKLALGDLPQEIVISQKYGWYAFTDINLEFIFFGGDTLTTLRVLY